MTYIRCKESNRSIIRHRRIMRLLYVFKGLTTKQMIRDTLNSEA